MLRRSIKLTSYIILLSLCSINISSAYINYEPENNQIFVKDEHSVNLTNIYNILSPKYGDSLISNKGNGLWYINKTIAVDRSTLNIKTPEVTELRIYSDGNNWLLHGTSTGSSAKGICVDGVKIIGWNRTSDTADSRSSGRPLIEIDKGHASNTTFEKISILDLYNVNDIILQNITVRNCTGYVQIRNGANLTVKNLQLDHLLAFYTDDISTSEFSNIRVNDTLTGGNVVFTHTNYSTFHDITLDGIGYPRPTGDQGVGGFNCIMSCHNIGYNISINDTGWSGFAPGGNNNSWSNIIVRNSGHNGIDLHNIQNTTINNAKIFDSLSNNIVITAGYITSPWSDNITLKNIYSYNSGIVSDTGVTGIYIENVTQEGSRNGMGINAVNFTVVNATFAPHDAWASMNIYKLGDFIGGNISLIDSSIYTINSETGPSGNKVINCKMASLPDRVTNKTEYYYADIAVKDQDGNPLSGTVKFSNELNSIFGSVDGLGHSKSQFQINLGRTYLPTQIRSESPAIPVYSYVNNIKYGNFTHDTTVSTVNGSVILRNIVPTSTWYRSNPNTPTYTITAIITEDSDRTHVIGFAPSTENPFNPGEKKNFKVWTDGNLTGMKWLVDNKTVAEGVLNYTWTVNKTVSKVEFSGWGANGNVSQVWNFSEKSGDKTTHNSPTSDGNQTQVVKFFPESTALTKNSGESVTFNVNSSQLLSTNWFIDGKLVQNNTATMVKSWNTSGTYNVTFSGSASGKPVIHSWFVYVIDSSNYHPLWDVKEDGIVDTIDITSISRHYGEIYKNKPYPRWDVNQDGVINIQDLYLAGDHFGETVN